MTTLNDLYRCIGRGVHDLNEDIAYDLVARIINIMADTGIEFLGRSADGPYIINRQDVIQYLVNEIKADIKDGDIELQEMDGYLTYEYVKA